jgi:hypothetical protein
MSDIKWPGPTTGCGRKTRMYDDGSRWEQMSITTPEYGTSLPSACELQLVEPNIVMDDGVRFDG